jgi:hypothetical protein
MYSALNSFIHCNIISDVLRVPPAKLDNIHSFRNEFEETLFCCHAIKMNNLSSNIFPTTPYFLRKQVQMMLQSCQPLKYLFRTFSSKIPKFQDFQGVLQDYFLKYPKCTWIHQNTDMTDAIAIN